MTTVIGADAARLAGLQIDMLGKYRAGQLSLDHCERFLNLSPEAREERFGDGKKPKPEPVLDFLVRVDRSVKPSYPDWFKKLEHPELECAGPAEYDLQTAVQLWLHDDQRNGVVVGNTIHKHLKKDNGLASCLNLQDGLAIQAKGIAVFRKLFAGKAVFLWGSVVRRRDGDLRVPYLCERDGKVVVLWCWLDYDWYDDNPALRFELKKLFSCCF